MKSNSCNVGRSCIRYLVETRIVGKFKESKSGQGLVKVFGIF